MRDVLVIGIGAGDPDHLTIQAVKGIQAADAFFVVDKPGAARELTEFRRALCDRHVRGDAYRWIEVRDAERDRDAPDYRTAVEEWRAHRCARYTELIRDELADGECGAFLVWGDPGLYDSTITILDDVARDSGVEFAVRVLPGISSVQALAARHGIPLNRVGEPVLVTPGRRLASLLPLIDGSVVVMLDASCSFLDVADDDDDVYWGAYLGSPDEILIHGRVADVRDEIRRRRGAARDRKGWIMDTCLLRRARPADATSG